MPQQAPQLKRYEQPAGNWIDGREFGVTTRHLQRLFDQLKSLGAARKPRRGVYLFDRNHPDIVPRLRKARRDRSYADMSDLTAKQVADAEHKKRIVETGQREIAKRMADKGCGRTEAVMWFCTHRAAEIPELDVPEGVKVRSFTRWEGKWKKSTHKLRALIDTRGRGGSESSKRSPEAWEFFKKLYLDERKRQLKYCWERTRDMAEDQGWDWPGYRTVCRQTDCEIPKSTLVLAREGRHAWEAQCAPRMERSYEDFPANKLWCGDEHTLDVYCRVLVGRGKWKLKRPVITAWLDQRSRVFVGWHISRTGNSDTILAAFRNGIRRFGPPEEVHIDNGADYKSVGGRKKKKKWESFDQDRLISVYTELEITPRWAIPYGPWSKMIESHFRKVCEHFAKRQPTYCGNTPGNRPEDITKRLIHTLPTIEEVGELFGEWLETEHHNSEQFGSGMYGYTPLVVMREFLPATVRETPPDYLLDYLCARVVTKTVKVHKQGVTFEGLHYGASSTRIMRLFGREVRLKIHPDTRDFVDVIDLDGKAIDRARHDVLDGTKATDQKAANSRRKAALKVARKEMPKAVSILRQSKVATIRAVQREREQAEREAQQPPEPPKMVKAVRPDLDRERIKAMAGELDSSTVQRRSERRSKAIDFETINAALGIAPHGESADESTDLDPADGRIDVAALLESNRLDGGFANEENVEDQEESIDAFEILGRSNDERRQRA